MMDDAAKANGIDAPRWSRRIYLEGDGVPMRSRRWYQANQARVSGAPLDQVRQPIRGFLTQERLQTAREVH